MCTVRAESVSAVYLVEATSVSVTHLDRLESWLCPQLKEGILQDLIVSTTWDAAFLSLGRAEGFLKTSYQNFSLCEPDKPLDLRDHPKLANQAFPWGVSERAYVIFNLYYIIT